MYKNQTDDTINLNKDFLIGKTIIDIDNRSDSSFCIYFDDNTGLRIVAWSTIDDETYLTYEIIDKD